MSEEEINEGLIVAYREAGHNAYFGNGFHAGVEFANSADDLEIDRLKDLIFNMTHHEGALEETKSVWIKVIADRLGPKND